MQLLQPLRLRLDLLDPGLVAAIDERKGGGFICLPDINGLTSAPGHHAGSQPPGPIKIFQSGEILNISQSVNRPDDQGIEIEI